MDSALALLTLQNLKPETILLTIYPARDINSTGRGTAQRHPIRGGRPEPGSEDRQTPRREWRAREWEDCGKM